MEIHDPVDQKKKLNITVIADSSAYGQCALRYGELLAVVFKASLTVVSNFGFSLEPRNSGKVMAEVMPQLAPDTELIVRTDYFFPERIYRFAEETNTIMFVIGVDRAGNQGLFNCRRALGFIKPSRIPVMTVGKALPASDAFRNVLLPLDIERYAKEKALWAGYFSRFYQSVIHVIYPSYADAGLQRQVHDNVSFVEKLYANLEVLFDSKAVQPQKDMDLFAVEYARNMGASLTVAIISRYFSLTDLFAGSRIRKIIGNSYDFPVLCINQRDDLYVLCT